MASSAVLDESPLVAATSPRDLDPARLTDAEVDDWDATERIEALVAADSQDLAALKWQDPDGTAVDPALPTVLAAYSKPQFLPSPTEYLRPTAGTTTAERKAGAAAAQRYTLAVGSTYRQATTVLASRSRPSGTSTGPSAPSSFPPLTFPSIHPSPTHLPTSSSSSPSGTQARASTGSSALGSDALGKRALPDLLLTTTSTTAKRARVEAGALAPDDEGDEPPDAPLPPLSVGTTETCPEEGDVVQAAVEWDVLEAVVGLAQGQPSYARERSPDLVDGVRAGLALATFGPTPTSTDPVLLASSSLLAVSRLQTHHAHLFTTYTTTYQAASFLPAPSLAVDIAASLPPSSTICYELAGSRDEAEHLLHGHASNDRARYDLFAEGAHLVWVQGHGRPNPIGDASTWWIAIFFDGAYVDARALETDLERAGLKPRPPRRRSADSESLADRISRWRASFPEPERDILDSSIINTTHSPLAAAAHELSTSSAAVPVETLEPTSLQASLNKSSLYYNAYMQLVWTVVEQDGGGRVFQQEVVTENGTVVLKVAFFPTVDSAKAALSSMFGGAVDPERIASVSASPPRGVLASSRVLMNRTLGAQLVLAGQSLLSTSGASFITAISTIATSTGGLEMKMLTVPKVYVPAKVLHYSGGGVWPVRRTGALLRHRSDGQLGGRVDTKPDLLCLPSGKAVQKLQQGISVDVARLSTPGWNNRESINYLNLSIPRVPGVSHRGVVRHAPFRLKVSQDPLAKRLWTKGTNRVEFKFAGGRLLCFFSHDASTKWTPLGDIAPPLLADYIKIFELEVEMIVAGGLQSVMAIDPQFLVSLQTARQAYWGTGMRLLTEEARQDRVSIVFDPDRQSLRLPGHWQYWPISITRIKIGLLGLEPLLDLPRSAALLTITGDLSGGVHNAYVQRGKALDGTGTEVVLSPYTPPKLLHMVTAEQATRIVDRLNA